MNLTNPDKLKRDATSLLKAGWNADRITRHLVTNPADYGTGLHADGVRPIVLAVLDDLNREVRKQNAETRKVAADVRQVIRTTAADLARRDPSMKPFLDTLFGGRGHVRVSLRTTLR
jgi:hypothetical protein